MLEWGHVDFTLLDFLPEIKNTDQLLAYQHMQSLQSQRMQRAKQIFAGELDAGDDTTNNKKAKKKKKKKGLKIFEKAEDEVFLL